MPLTNSSTGSKETASSNFESSSSSPANLPELVSERKLSDNNITGNTSQMLDGDDNNDKVSGTNNSANTHQSQTGSSAFAVSMTDLSNFVNIKKKTVSTRDKENDDVHGKDDESVVMVSPPGSGSDLSLENESERDADTARRQSEINAFSVMAKSSIDQPRSSNNGDDDENMIDGARRQREMNAFAAMANPSVDVDEEIFRTGINNDVMEKDADVASRQKEISAFAAMVNGSVRTEMLSPDNGVDVLERDAARRQREMNAFAAMANGLVQTDQPDSPNKNKSEMDIEVDAARRQKEMSAFAAMANGSIEQQEVGSDSYEMVIENARRQREMNVFSAMANGSFDAIGLQSSISSKSFVREEAPQEMANGTFISDKKVKPKDSNRNLDAALASLEVASVQKSKDSGTEFESLQESCQMNQRKPDFSQMHNECINVAKPLFFGHILPPQIAMEMKKKQSQCSHLLNDGFQRELSDSSFISNNRNVDSLLSAFGHSNSQSPGDSTETEDEPEINTTTYNHVTLYEPVWGDFRRLHREDRIKSTSMKENECYVCDDVGNDVGNDESCDSDDEILNITKPSTALEMKSNENNEAPHTNDKFNEPSPIEENKGAEKADSQDLFLQYARGDINNYGDSLLWQKGNLTSVPETNAVDSNTFRQVTDSNGSFEGSELKKQVGLNDNLSKALESLSVNTGVGGTTAASLAAADAGAAAIEAARAISVAVKDGRPLTNLELASGKVPVYGCDDDPLPNPNDLGIYETKEDQIQSIRQYDSQEIIASRAVPNIFGPIVCPSNCLGPDDSQSWFSRRSRGHSDFSGRVKHPHHGYSNSFQVDKISATNIDRSRTANIDSVMPPQEDKSDLPSPLPPPPQSKVPQSVPKSRRHMGRESSVSFSQHPPSPSLKKSRTQGDNRNNNNPERRVGWWNISNDFGLKPPRKNRRSAFNGKQQLNSPLQLPPLRDETRHDFSWMLYPSQEKLTKENRSFAELHSAVDTVRCLPYLSDRDPHLRHVQIDTQIVAFPSIGEVEPMFCSVAIWHVHTTVSSEESDTPVVNVQGRITESLHFDVVSDPEVEKNCRTALWPYDQQELGPDESTSSDLTSKSDLQGTRCGVFPLHARYSMENLYAVIIVNKVLAEDNDLDVYMNPQKQKVDDRNHQTKNISPDLSKLRMKASKSADRFGRFLMPFAFGVAPLVQILGSTPPTIPTSRAAQIPLFKLISGEGEKPIIDHILAVTNSR